MSVLGISDLLMYVLVVYFIYVSVVIIITQLLWNCQEGKILTSRLDYQIWKPGHVVMIGDRYIADCMSHHNR